MMSLLTDPQAWAALVTLSALEIVLGIDNVVFISVLVARLEPKQAKRARQIGLSLALLFRIALLFALTKLIGLGAPVFTVLGNSFSWHDIILIGGGLFLIAKATHEMHAEIEGDEDENPGAKAARAAFSIVIAQVVVIDIVFSIDSIVTAIGMAQDIRIMIAAVLIAVVIMYAASGPVSAFILNHPTTKMLALAFLVLIGMALIADGFDFHVPRGYIYFAMAFAGAVEAVNIVAKRRRSRRK
jgi:predicted tellurium resistance membrane protein TerC